MNPPKQTAPPGSKTVPYTLFWMFSGLACTAMIWSHDHQVATPLESLLFLLATLATNLGLGVVSGWFPQRRVRLALGVALPLLLAGFWFSVADRSARPVPARPNGKGPDIVLVTLDTFRADYVGVLGGRGRTPHLDHLAKSGALFEDAVTTAPLTAPAHASMLTGLETHGHGLTANGSVLRAPSVVPELRASGYRTAAFVSSPVLSRKTRLDQGFDHYDDRWGWARLPWVPLGRSTIRRHGLLRSGDRTIERALAWWDATDGPRLLWIHLFDPHAPYRPPRRFLKYAALEEARALDAQHVENDHTAGNLQTVLQDLMRRNPHARRVEYEGEIHWTDSLVGRVVQHLPTDTLLIVAADHGESLGEHDYWFNHGARLYEPSLHVPILMRWHDHIPGETRVSALTSVADIADTLRTAAGIPATSRGLLDRIDGTALESVTAFTSGQEARPTLGSRTAGTQWYRGAIAASRTASGKLEVRREDGARWFDLAQDPHERVPLTALPEHAQAVLPRLEALVEQPPPAVDPEQAQHLRELGYLTR